MWPVISRSAVTSWCSVFSANDETVASGAAGRGAARGHYGEPKLINPERAMESNGNDPNAECGMRNEEGGMKKGLN